MYLNKCVAAVSSLVSEHGSIKSVEMLETKDRTRVLALCLWALPTTAITHTETLQVTVMD